MHGRRILAAAALAAGVLAFSAPAFAADYQEDPPSLDDAACDPSATADWTPEQWATWTAAIDALIADGYDFGPPPCGQVEPECVATIDPPEAIEVTISGVVVDGVATDYTDTQTYAGNGTGLARFDLSAVAHGTQHVALEATWNIGTSSLHIEGDTTCPELPPTTTTPPTTAPPTHVCPGGATTSVETPCEAPTPTSVVGTPIPATPAPTLPHTGAESDLAAVGLVLAGCGGALARRFRPRR